MLCTIIILTYLRPKELIRCVDSFLKYATDKSQLIIYGRTIDIETMKVIPEICAKKKDVIFMLADNLTGYTSHPHFIRQSLRLADGEWIMIQSDDCTFESEWESHLEKHGNESEILSPATWRNGGSTYRHDADCPFFFIGKEDLIQLMPKIDSLYDHSVLRTMRGAGKAQIYMDGFEVWHENLTRVP